MSNVRTLVVAVLTVVICSLLVVACGQPPLPEVDPAHRSVVEGWRAERLERLSADDGWLTLVGLFWLEEGDNPVGSGADSNVLLPADAAPEAAAVITLAKDGSATLRSVEGVELTIEGEPVVERAIVSDAGGKPDVIRLGRLSFYLLSRGDRLAVRVKDPEAETLTDFAGIEAFAIDPAFRVQARFEAYESPKEVTVTTAVGTETAMKAPGVLHFEIDGQQQTLEAFEASNDRLWIIFRDTTAGTETYGAGRFLYADAPSAGLPDSSVTLDFNLAYNPPCAFTPYATCPLAPAANQLEVPIRAGERYSGSH